MKIPYTQRRKALIIIDVQKAFLRPHSQYIIQNICTLIDKADYDLYATAVFYAGEDSLWKQQQDWTCPKGENTVTDQSLVHGLRGREVVNILKSTRSVFGGHPDLAKSLKDNSIEEVHLVGTETNDCVLVTAFDAFDLGYPTYVLEECCESQREEDHQLGLTLLRNQKMTNNSCLAETAEI